MQSMSREQCFAWYTLSAYAGDSHTNHHSTLIHPPVHPSLASYVEIKELLIILLRVHDKEILIQKLRLPKQLFIRNRYINNDLIRISLYLESTKLSQKVIVGKGGGLVLPCWKLTGD